MDAGRVSPCSVEDGNQVLRQIWRHPVSFCLGNHERERQEHTPEEAETTRNSDDEFGIFEWSDEIGNRDRFLRVR